MKCIQYETQSIDYNQGYMIGICVLSGEQNRLLLALELHNTKEVPIYEGSVEERICLA